MLASGPALAGRPAAPDASPRPLRLILASGLALALLATLVGLILAVRSSFFYADDYLNMGLARANGLGITLLKWSVFGELAPGHRFLDWVMGVKIGLHWTWALIIMLAFWATAVAAFERLLSELTDDRLLVTLATALFACAPAFVRIMQWWANAEHEMPWMAFTLLCLFAALRWRARRSRPWLLIAALSYLMALLFYAEAVLTPLFLVALAYFVPSRAYRPLSARRVREDLPLWVVLVTFTVIYVVLVKAGGYLSVPKPAGASTWIAYFRVGWLQGISPYVIGQSSVPNSGGISPGVAVAAQLVLALVIVASLVRSRAAWRAWVFYVAVWAVAAFIVGNGRLGLYGPSMADDPRYNAEMAFILPLTLALAFTAPRAGRPPHLDGRPVGGRFAPGAVVLLAALAVSVGFSYGRLAHAWPAREAGAWAGHVRSSLAALRRRGVQPSVIDGDVPATVEPENQGQFSLLSSVLPMFRAGIVVADQTGRDPPALMAPDGTIRLARAQVQAAWSGAALEQRGVASVAAPGAARLLGHVLCVSAQSSPVLVTLGLEQKAIGTGSMLELELPPDGGAGELFVYLDSGSGYPVLPSQRFVLGPAARIVRMTLAQGRLLRARVDVQADSRMCLQGVRVTRYRGA